MDLTRRNWLETVKSRPSPTHGIQNQQNHGRVWAQFIICQLSFSLTSADVTISETARHHRLSWKCHCHSVSITACLWSHHLVLEAGKRQHNQECMWPATPLIVISSMPLAVALCLYHSFCARAVHTSSSTRSLSQSATSSSGVFFNCSSSPTKIFQVTTDCTV